MNPPYLASDLPPELHAPMPKKPRKRGLVYALVGCGCLSLVLIVLVVVAVTLVAMSADESASSPSQAQSPQRTNAQSIEEQLKNLKVGESLKFSSNTQGGPVRVSPPTRGRKARARKTADKLMRYLEKRRMASAWRMFDPSVKKKVGRLDDFRAVADVRQPAKSAAAGKRVVFAQEHTTIAIDGGRLVGAQVVGYRYRQKNTSSVVECTVGVLDSQVLPEDHGLPRSNDFEIIHFKCVAKS